MAEENCRLQNECASIKICSTLDKRKVHFCFEAIHGLYVNNAMTSRLYTVDKRNTHLHLMNRSTEALTKARASHVPKGRRADPHNQPPVCQTYRAGGFPRRGCSLLKMYATPCAHNRSQRDQTNIV